MPRCQFRLLSASPSKIAIIKALRQATRPPLGLSEAKYFVDNPPGTLHDPLEEVAARTLYEQLEQLGCEVELLPFAEVSLAVRLESAGPRKINVIKVVREVLGVGLKAAKDRVDSAPFEVPMGEDRAAAEALASKLTEAGADAHVIGGGQDEEEWAASGLAGAVVLEQVGPRKISVIKVVREHLKLGLAEAKDLVESAPVVLKEVCDSAEARDLARQLESAGARVSLGTKETSSEPSGPLEPVPY